MQGTNVLFGQIAVVFGIVIAGVWGATQWTAAALGYQLRLGSPWFDLLGTPIYHPWKLFEWWFFFDAYAPRVFDTGGAIAGGSGLLAVVVAIGMSIWRSRQSHLVTTYGSARWANAEDIRKAGLTQPAGVFLGQHDRKYLRHEGPEHVLTFAPTRSGKGVGLVVPTLLSWPTSAVIHDIKGSQWKEVYDLVPQMRLDAEQGRFRIPHNRKLRNAFTKIQRIQATNGEPKFVATRDAEGHADEFSATLLAYYASKRSSGGNPLNDLPDRNRDRSSRKADRMSF